MDDAPLIGFIKAVRAGRSAALATIVAGWGMGRKMLVTPGKEPVGALGNPELEAAIEKIATQLLAEQRSARLELPVGEASADIFIDVHTPPPRLLVIGAVHTAIALVEFANRLGFFTAVIDPRSAFATRERFGHADALLTEWPDQALPRLGLDESTYLAALTHDEKIDNPALALALRSPARYVGALGARSTHARRVESLRRDYGLTDAEVARIHAPIGLDLGGRSPEEIALAIMAEVVAARYGKLPP